VKQELKSDWEAKASPTQVDNFNELLILFKKYKFSKDRKNRVVKSNILFFLRLCLLFVHQLLHEKNGSREAQNLRKTAQPEGCGYLM